MMETAELLSLVEHLEDNIDDLEESLEPLLATALSATTKKLPVLDKAKLYVLIVYSIESLLFSYLRLNGVQAKEHPVFNELTRVKQYFEKVKVAEAGPTRPRETLTLNKQAAGRVIKNALAGNNKYDLERAEREAREKLLAKRKLNKLTDKTMLQKQPQEPPQDVGNARKDAKSQEDSDMESSSENDDQEDNEMADPSGTAVDAIQHGPEATLHARDGFAGPRGRFSGKEKRGGKTKRKKRRGLAMPKQSQNLQASARGKRRKRKQGGPPEKTP